MFLNLCFSICMLWCVNDSYLPNNMARLQSLQRESRGLSKNKRSHTIMHRTGMDSRSRLACRKRFKQFNQAQVTHREAVQTGKSFQICRLKNRSETGSTIRVCAMCVMHVLLVLHWIALSLLTLNRHNFLFLFYFFRFN